MQLTAFINGIGVLCPGINNWPEARSILSSSVVYVADPIMVPTPNWLPRTESRRVGMVVKLALTVAQEAITAGQLDAKQLACVFCSSAGDGDCCNTICETLASTDRHISPTRFHNSVHNAPVGYWSIAVNARTPATMLCAYDGSFGAGLLEAISQILINNTGVLLAAYDVPYPEPLHSKRPLPAAFGLSLALLPKQTELSLAQIEVCLTTATATTLAIPELEDLRINIPVARGLPLLQILAQGGGTVVLDYLEPQRLSVKITPCY